MRFGLIVTLAAALLIGSPLAAANSQTTTPQPNVATRQAPGKPAPPYSHNPRRDRRLDQAVNDRPRKQREMSHPYYGAPPYSRPPTAAS